MIRVMMNSRSLRHTRRKSEERERRETRWNRLLGRMLLPQRSPLHLRCIGYARMQNAIGDFVRLEEKASEPALVRVPVVHQRSRS